MKQTTIDITVGDVRKSSDDFMDIKNCHLCNAVKRTFNYENIAVGSTNVAIDCRRRGKIYPEYNASIYHDDKQFVASNPDLPDTHVIRTLQFKTTSL